jgi:hypothetical protein
MMANIDRARFAAARGRASEASARLAEAEETFSQQPDGLHREYARARLHVVRAEVALANDDPEGVLAMTELSTDLSLPHARPKYAFYAWLARARALVALSRHADARTAFDHAIALLDDMDEPSLVLRAFEHAAAGIDGLRSRAREAAIRIAASLEGKPRARFEATSVARAALTRD